MNFVDMPRRVNVKEEIDSFKHYGMPRRSGRYPWGSGENPYQRTWDFLSRVEQYQKQGMSKKEMAEAEGISMRVLTARIALDKNERDLYRMAAINALKQEGVSNADIALTLGMAGESSVRSLINKMNKDNRDTAMKAADKIRQQIDEKGIIDISEGVEIGLGISQEKMTQAIEILKGEGYEAYTYRQKQVGQSGQYTLVKTIGLPGTTYGDVYQPGNVHLFDPDHIHQIDAADLRIDDAEHPKSFVYPESLDSKRIGVRYADDPVSGADRDGLIEIRPGVEDISIGTSHYSQVRILVDGTHYIKGMAVYNPDLPEGVDIMVNSNKMRGTPLKGESSEKSVLKPAKQKDIEAGNPFGTNIMRGGQSYWTDEKGQKHLRVINKREDEGGWDSWADKLSSQFLGKQSFDLIKSQLNLTYKDVKMEFDEIMALENPVIKKYYLEQFAGKCDGNAVHLKAAALPRQHYQVILPIPSLKDNEVYAPNYDQGEEVTLVRFPHAGPSEIPRLTVNNKNKEALKLIGNMPKDAIGINAKVAEKLSGADFDGDTVMVIPTKTANIITKPTLPGLSTFNNKLEYPYREGMTVLSKDRTQIEMGKISNLITDMYLQGADEKEMARAVKHSMVVIDANKHKLDWQKSERDNEIETLKRKYQSKDNGKFGGASTLLSKAKSGIYVDKYRGTQQIDPETGKLGDWKFKGKTNVLDTFVDYKTGETVVRQVQRPAMSLYEDAHELSRGTRQEELYANFANQMKAMANESRKAMVAIKPPRQNAAAAKIYATEVASLRVRLNEAKLNAPREREAQRRANAFITEQIKMNPDLGTKAGKKELKKISARALNSAREEVGAHRVRITISDKDWEAIQSGAVSATMLRSLLNFCEPASLREKATPQNNKRLSDARVRLIKSRLASGYTPSEIADAMGIPVSTVQNYANNE